MLTKRPAKVKKIYEIKYSDRKSPTENRNSLEFFNYYNEIWKELDINV